MEEIIFPAESSKALDEITEVVGELVVIGRFEFFPGEIGVNKIVDMAKEEIAKSIDAMFFNYLDWIDNIAD